MGDWRLCPRVQTKAKGRKAAIEPQQIRIFASSGPPCLLAPGPTCTRRPGVDQSPFNTMTPATSAVLDGKRWHSSKRSLSCRACYRMRAALKRHWRRRRQSTSGLLLGMRPGPARGAAASRPPTWSRDVGLEADAPQFRFESVGDGTTGDTMRAEVLERPTARGNVRVNPLWPTKSASDAGGRRNRSNPHG